MFEEKALTISSSGRGRFRVAKPSTNPNTIVDMPIDMFLVLLGLGRNYKTKGVEDLVKRGEVMIATASHKAKTQRLWANSLVHGHEGRHRKGSQGRWVYNNARSH